MFDDVMLGELSEIDRVRWERDVARAENARLRAENERLAMLLMYAEAAMREEFRLRIESATPGERVVSFKGRLNRYVCERCGGQIITVDADDGVTPFALMCRAAPSCSGLMYSSFYRDVRGVPSFEWRRPTAAEYAGMSAAGRAHVDLGGLELYVRANARGH